jgi:hypothetical protein
LITAGPNARAEFVAAPVYTTPKLTLAETIYHEDSTRVSLTDVQ